MIRLTTIFFCAVSLFASCKKDWLEREPQTILTNDQIWNDPDLIVSVLAQQYNRLPNHYSLTAGWQLMAEYDEAMWSGFGNDEWRNNLPNYDLYRWSYWDYVLIRDINLSIDELDQAQELDPEVKAGFIAEFRFLRAYVYFELVKRMGGVPIITEQLLYDYSGDASSLQRPRNTEAEVYDFIAEELDQIKDQLGNAGSQTRANKYTALALKSRAMLYAGSLAKYNNLMGAPIQTQQGEVGISADRAAAYYAASLEASQEIINDGQYTLYDANPDLGANFYDAITNKSGNTEVIWAQDFALGKTHFFTYDNIFRSAREDNLSPSAITPSLNLVEAYEYLDGTPGTLRARNEDGSDYIYYDHPEDIFANKDSRLYGTVIFPGTAFRGVQASIQAGVKVWNGTSYQTLEGNVGSNHNDGGTLTGLDGPSRSQLETTNTGFYLRKYVDATPGAGQRSQLSTMWWVRFRLGEVLLNAAEAALELGQEAIGLTYVNQLRERAGFPPNSLSSLTLQQLVNERRVELAFEDHRLWDLKRWRIAHQIWDGSPNGAESNIFALYPYRIVNPEDPSKHGKYVFDKIRAPRFRASHFFQLQNYYAGIPQDVLNNNDLITRNPFQ